MYVCGVNGVCVCVWYMVYGSMRVHVVNGVCGVCILCVYVCLVNGVCVCGIWCVAVCVYVCVVNGVGSVRVRARAQCM